MTQNYDYVLPIVQERINAYFHVTLIGPRASDQIRDGLEVRVRMFNPSLRLGSIVRSFGKHITDGSDGALPVHLVKKEAIRVVDGLMESVLRDVEEFHRLKSGGFWVRFKFLFR
jgi:hypothetical protein